ncbi:MAG: YggS family pyridoxal phosphate-dependent enzyme [bacterium]|nr:YggS family pyridoxal phosphate-dependent enzyme [bacterium]
MNDLIPLYEATLSKIETAAKRSGRGADDVTLVAVTKTHGPETVRDAIDAGMTLFGENKVQEAAWKIPMCPTSARWQLIGHLQSNKVKHAVRLFETIHSVDSIKLFDALEAAARQAGTRPEIYLEVNVSGEPSKYGLTPAMLPATIEHILNHSQALTLSGLMTMAPFDLDPEAARPHFVALRNLRDQMEKDFGIDLYHLSMGMSGDFEVAIEEGATDVRIGTALFGARPKITRPTLDADTTSGIL